MKVRFPCPICERPGRLEFNGQGGTWACPACEHRLELQGDGSLSVCAICNNNEIYKKKDFPHWLGLTILTAACLGFLVAMARFEWWWAWGILIGSALFDGLLYLWVGDAVACYRCGAHYRGIQPGPAHKPFELIVAERYRQERLRREQLKQ